MVRLDKYDTVYFLKQKPHIIFYIVQKYNKFTVNSNYIVNNQKGDLKHNPPKGTL